MRWRFFTYITLAAIMPFPIFASGVNNSSAKFKVTQQTMVPGTTLKPGSYSIRVLDHLQDRFIIRIEQVGGSSKATFIGVRSPALMSTAHSGTVLWGAAPEGEAALRGFTFGHGTPPIEFVYPKDDAVALAKLNDGQVPAVDPASEGKPAQLSGLSKSEMQMVTLWMLSPTRVGPNDSAGPQIKAEKLTQVASAKSSKPPIARLPHTASDLPAILWIGLLATVGAVFLAGRRLAA